MSRLTEDDWDKIHELADEYYKRHGELIKEILAKAPEAGVEDLRYMMSDRSSVFSHPTR